MEQNIMCPICLECLLDAKEIGLPDSCAHAFCSDCISTWSKCSNACPVDRLQFSTIVIKDLNGATAAVLDVLAVTEPDWDVGETLVEHIKCEICSGSDNEHMLLLCDNCNKGYHCSCLNPPLPDVPAEEWFCPTCNSERNENEFQQGTSSNVDRVSTDPTSSPRRKRRGRKPRMVARTRLVERIRSSVQVTREMNREFDDDQSSIRKRETNRLLDNSEVEQGFVEVRRRLADRLGIVKARNCPGLSQFDITTYSKTESGRGVARNSFLDLTGANIPPIPIEEDLCQARRSPPKQVPTQRNANVLGTILESQNLLKTPDYRLKISSEGSISSADSYDSVSQSRINDLTLQTIGIQQCEKRLESVVFSEQLMSELNEDISEPSPPGTCEMPSKPEYETDTIDNEIRLTSGENLVNDFAKSNNSESSKNSAMHTEEDSNDTSEGNLLESVDKNSECMPSNNDAAIDPKSQECADSEGSLELKLQGENWNVESKVSEGLSEDRKKFHANVSGCKLNCETCKFSHDEVNMMTCHELGCNKSYHCQCLDPPLFEIPSGMWKCPDCSEPKQFPQKTSLPPFKPLLGTDHSKEGHITANTDLRNYEIPKKSHQPKQANEGAAESRVSLSDITTEPSPEELEKMGLPGQFNSNVMQREQEENSSVDSRERFSGRYDYENRGWRGSGGRAPFGSPRGRWNHSVNDESSRNNRGMFDRGNRGGRFSSEFAASQRGRNEFQPRVSRWSDDSSIYMPQQSNTEHSEANEVSMSIPEQGDNSQFNSVKDSTEEKTADTKSDEINHDIISRKREHSKDTKGEKIAEASGTDKDSRRRSRSKSSDSRKRRRDRSSSRKRSDFESDRHRNDRSRNHSRSRDYDDHRRHSNRSRRSRSRSRKRYDSDRNEDRRGGSRDTRVRESRFDRNDSFQSRRYGKVEDERGDQEFNTANNASRFSRNNFEEVPINDSSQPLNPIEQEPVNIGQAKQITPTKDEGVQELTDHGPVIDPATMFQQRGFTRFPPPFEGERPPMFMNNLTPPHARFPRPRGAGFPPRYPNSSSMNPNMPFNALGNAPPPMSEQQFSSLMNPALNSRFMQPDFARPNLQGPMNGGPMAFHNPRIPNPNMGQPPNFLGARLPFPFNNTAVVNSMGAPRAALDANMFQQFANNLSNAASSQNAQSLDQVQKLISSQDNAASPSQPNDVAALLRQIESNKLLQSVASLNTNTPTAFPTSPQRGNRAILPVSTPETTGRPPSGFAGSSISPISLSNIQSNIPMINNILESHFQNQQHQSFLANAGAIQQMHTFGGNLSSFPSQNSSPELVEMEDSVLSPRVEMNTSSAAEKPDEEHFLKPVAIDSLSPTIPFMEAVRQSLGAQDSNSGKDKKKRDKQRSAKKADLSDSEDQTAEIESSANEMQLKRKQVDRSDLQTKVAELIKALLMPHFRKHSITKEEYKDIMRKSVNKVVKRGNSDLKEDKISKLVNAYVDHYRAKRTKSSKDDDDF